MHWGPLGVAGLVIAALLALEAASQAVAPLPNDGLTSRAARATYRVHPTVETHPVPHSGDAADDPAVWVDRRHRGKSLVIGNDKRGGLEVYSLHGRLRQRITTGRTFWGNVDVLQRVDIRGRTLDVVATMNGQLRLYTVNRERQLVPITESGGVLPSGGGEGLCMLASRRGAAHVFVIRRDGRVRQFRLVDPDADGRLSIRLTRQFHVGSEAEGCVADSGTGALYISEEDVGLWRYGAGPGSGRRRVLVDGIGTRGHLVNDVEGVTLVRRGRHGQIVVSAQNGVRPTRSYFAVYTRRTNHYVGSFRVSGGQRGDGCSRTDGIHAYAGRLGPAFPRGIFICQDDHNTRPDPGHQNFKLTPLQRIFPMR